MASTTPTPDPPRPHHNPTLSAFTISLLSGAFAGSTVDLTLHPLDTLKTRLQSPLGFFGSGGFRRIYSGVLPVILGSAPGASLFFITYDTLKRHLPESSPTSHMLSASVGEIAACLVRVPTEVVKQRAQARQYPSSLAAFLSILRPPTQSPSKHILVVPVLRELYTGWSATLLREIPFTMIQFPLWEYLKSKAEKRTPIHSSVFGSLAGAVAALATTPLDVLKTRIMLSRSTAAGGAGGVAEGSWDGKVVRKEGVVRLAGRILREEGPGAFMRGWAPRVMWISAGGAIFLGAYDLAKGVLGAY
ncbi:mitochondrial carrier domain-containing protein [Peziza echinospora]|nr:mitochondrial carrier domain-containing protein [Peziza echinospora]